jgi:hypothetical protein
MSSSGSGSEPDVEEEDCEAVKDLKELAQRKDERVSHKFKVEPEYNK